MTNPTNRKLSEADIQEIRRAYAAGEGSLAVLGHRYGVSRQHIHRILDGVRPPQPVLPKAPTTGQGAHAPTHAHPRPLRPSLAPLARRHGGDQGQGSIPTPPSGSFGGQKGEGDPSRGAGLDEAAPSQTLFPARKS